MNAFPVRQRVNGVALTSTPATSLALWNTFHLRELKDAARVEYIYAWLYTVPLLPTGKNEDFPLRTKYSQLRPKIAQLGQSLGDSIFAHECPDDQYVIEMRGLVKDLFFFCRTIDQFIDHLRLLSSWLVRDIPFRDSLYSSFCVAISLMRRDFDLFVKSAVHDEICGPCHYFSVTFDTNLSTPPRGVYLSYPFHNNLPIMSVYLGASAGTVVWQRVHSPVIPLPGARVISPSMHCHIRSHPMSGAGYNTVSYDMITALSDTLLSRPYEGILFSGNGYMNEPSIISSVLATPLELFSSAPTPSIQSSQPDFPLTSVHYPALLGTTLPPDGRQILEVKVIPAVATCRQIARSDVGQLPPLPLNMHPPRYLPQHIEYDLDSFAPVGWTHFRNAIDRIMLSPAFIGMPDDELYDSPLIPDALESAILYTMDLFGGRDAYRESRNGVFTGLPNYWTPTVTRYPVTYAYALTYNPVTLTYDIPVVNPNHQTTRRLFVFNDADMERAAGVIGDVNLPGDVTILWRSTSAFSADEFRAGRRFRHTITSMLLWADQIYYIKVPIAAHYCWPVTVRPEPRASDFFALALDFKCVTLPQLNLAIASVGIEKHPVVYNDNNGYVHVAAYPCVGEWFNILYLSHRPSPNILRLPEFLNSSYFAPSKIVRKVHSSDRESHLLTLRAFFSFGTFSDVAAYGGDVANGARR